MHWSDANLYVAARLLIEEEFENPTIVEFEAGGGAGRQYLPEKCVYVGISDRKWVKTVVPIFKADTLATHSYDVAMNIRGKEGPVGAMAKLARAVHANGLALYAVDLTSVDKKALVNAVSQFFRRSDLVQVGTKRGLVVARGPKV